MPFSVPLRPELIDELITHDRLSSYQQVFSASSDYELVGSYLWNAKVCSSLYPLIGAAEIALRNSVDRALVSSQLGRFWWSNSRLQWRSRPQGILPQSVRNLQGNFSKASAQVVRDKRDRYQIQGATPTHHEIISKTEFSTWEFIFDSEFMGRGQIWPQHLGRVFRGDWQGRRPSIMIAHARDLVSTVRTYRNRLFHHEPAWKRAGISNEVEAIAYLQLRLRQVVDLMDLIHPNQALLLRKNGILGDAERACSIQELRRFQLLARESVIRSCRNFSVAAKASIAENAAIVIKSTGRNSRKFLLVPYT